MHHQYNKYRMNKSLFKKIEKGFSEKNTVAYTCSKYETTL